MVTPSDVTLAWQVSQVYDPWNGWEASRSDGELAWHEVQVICDPSTWVHTGGAGALALPKVAPWQ
jgi:hypothetical protein